MLLLVTFEDPSSGSRTTEKRPRPTSFTVPISSEATCETSFDVCSASTNRSFIQRSSSSCCSPYTLRDAAGSRRTGSSCRIRVASPAIRASSFERSRSPFAACSASVTSVPRPSSVLDVPSFEMVLELVLAAVEVPPRGRVFVRKVREDAEVLHALAPNVCHLGFGVLLAERVLPDRAAREEPGGAASAGVVHQSAEHVEVGARAEDDPGDLGRAREAFTVLSEFVRVGRHLGIPGELRLQHIESERGEDLGRPDDRVRLLVRELF